jgi:X-Pro dipeptidyl-peptidase
VRVYEALKANGVPAMAYFHQDGHGGPPPPRLMNRWFTRYLYGVENGVENDPRAWIVREDAPRDRPTPYVDYPHPDASPVTLRPRAGGRRTGALGLDRTPGQGTESLIDNVSFPGAVLAKAEWSDHRLLYATPPLTEPVHLSGTARVTIRLAADAPAANLSVWVVSLPWDEEAESITANVVTRGWADPQNHETLVPGWDGDHSDLTGGEPLEPGRFYELSFPLQPDDQLLPAGSRIGLMIFSSDREFTLRPAPGTELTVDLDGTVLVLPVVGGAGALERALR